MSTPPEHPEDRPQPVYSPQQRRSPTAEPVLPGQRATVRGYSHRCPSCDEPVTANQAVCPQCGSRLHKRPEQIRCRHCGTRASSQLVLCPGCGRELQAAPSRLLTLGLPALVVALMVVILTGQLGNPLDWAQSQVNGGLEVINNIAITPVVAEETSTLPDTASGNGAIVALRAIGSAAEATSTPVQEAAAAGGNPVSAPESDVIAPAVVADNSATDNSTTDNSAAPPDPPAETVTDAPSSDDAVAVVSVTETPTETPTDLPTQAPTATETLQPTETPVPTNTPEPTATATATEVPTEAPTLAPSQTPTSLPTNTATVSPSPTRTTTATRSATQRATATPTRTATATGTTVNVRATLEAVRASLTSTASAAPTATNTATPTPQAVASYTVRSGDTLVGIAARFDIPTETLMQANGMTPSTAANLQVGRVLVLPGVPVVQDEQTQTYIVRTGDTIVGIALRFNVDTQELMRVNGFSEQQARTIQIGQVIVIPVPATTPIQVTPVQATPTPTRTPTPSASGSTSPSLTTVAQSNTSATATVSQEEASGVTVTLFEPGDNSSVQGKVAFHWQANSPLPAGTLFELVFWEVGQDPLVDGFGIAAPTTQSNVVADLDLLSLTPGHPLDFGQYRWGILIVRTTPSYARLAYGGTSFLITYEPSGNGCPPDDANCRNR